MADSLMGTRVFVSRTKPTLPAKIIEDANNAAAVTANTAARIAAWTTFDDGTVFTEVEGVVTVGNLGATFTMNTTTLLKNGLERPSKGSVNAGSGDFTLLYYKDDPGQEIIRRVGLSRDTCAFRYDYPDNESRYFIAHVGGDAIEGGDANTNKQMTAELTLDDFQVVVNNDV